MKTFWEVIGMTVFFLIFIQLFDGRLTIFWESMTKFYMFSIFHLNSVSLFWVHKMSLCSWTQNPPKPGDIYSKLHRLDSLPPAPFMCIFLRRWNSDHSKFSETSALHFKKHTSLKQECSLKLVIFTFGADLSIAVTTKKKSFKSRKPVYQCWRLNRS